MLLSLVINCDTRNENNTFGGENLKGCVSHDFLTEGILNKVRFFDGFEKEVIVYIDQHQKVSEETLSYIRTLADLVVVRNHTGEPKFNDNNYVRALSLASGDIICHIDQDVSCFKSSKDCVQDIINLLDNYFFVSYPSQFSPNPDVNDNYDYWWCSTRFFICKKESIDLLEIKKCLDDSDYLYSTYPASIRNPWFEHIAGLIAKYKGKGVYYPPIDADKLLIFSWDRYEQGILKMLNESKYQYVVNWVASRGIHYPADVTC